MLFRTKGNEKHVKVRIENKKCIDILHYRETYYSEYDKPSLLKIIYNYEPSRLYNFEIVSFMK